MTLYGCIQKVLHCILLLYYLLPKLNFIENLQTLSIFCDTGRVTLGSGPGVDILVQGTGVQSVHCHIENSEGMVTLYPLSDNLSIDGAKVAGPTRLSQGSLLHMIFQI